MDELLDAAAIDGLRTRLLAAAPAQGFERLAAVAAQVDGLKLRARVDLVEEALVGDLPSGWAGASDVVRVALEEPAFAGWTLWPVGEAMTSIALASPADGAFEDALALMAELTPRMSSEFAVRRLLAHDLDTALTAALAWTASPDPHVRRLASEGTRPYLPWAIRVREIVARPHSVVPILDALYRDPDEVVRRSVANHANDLSRHAPELLVDLAERWSAAPDDHTPSLVRHALRTLVKRGDERALAVRGYVAVAVTVANLRVSPESVALPGRVAIDFDLTNDTSAPADLAVDYLVHFRKANGTLAPKVFKLATVTLGPGETRSFRKHHTLRQMTTRVHHGGTHEVEVQVNGVRSGRAAFDVVV